MATPLAFGWEIKFQLACAERPGDAYQELFAQIMERRDPSFQRVRPWGNVGDRKNDGWSPERRTLFQCYAPSTMAMAKLEQKLDEDYDGAVAHWEDYFDTWIFVHDDLDGLAPAVAKKIADLNKKSESVTCRAWGYAELREEFALLDDTHRSAILGPALTPHDFLSVDASALVPLIAALGHMQADPAAAVAPVPATKIEANDLSAEQIAFLKLGASRAPLVEHYLSNAFVLPSHVDAIAEAVSSRYRSFRDEGTPPSLIFDLLLAWVTGGAIDSKTVANGLAILAYFFERCHIFEIPGSTS